jgi:hypothetical protein
MSEHKPSASSRRPTMKEMASWDEETFQVFLKRSDLEEPETIALGDGSKDDKAEPKKEG